MRLTQITGELTSPVFGKVQQEHLVLWPLVCAHYQTHSERFPAPVCRVPLLWRTCSSEHVTQLVDVKNAPPMDDQDQGLSHELLKHAVVQSGPETKISSILHEFLLIQPFIKQAQE